MIALVILSGAKDLTHEVWITLRPENAPSACARFLAALGMTAHVVDAA